MAKLRRRFEKGVELTPNDITSEDLTREGEIGVDSNDNKVKVRLDSATRSVVTEDQSQELTNKVIDGRDAAAKGNTVKADSDDIATDNSGNSLVATDQQATNDEIAGRLDTNEATLDDHETRITDIENDYGQPNGLATLDSNGKVPLSQLNNALLQYQGTYDASTNTPTLSNTDTGVENYWYRVNIAGTVDFGAGNITFNVGDKVVNNGTSWEKWDTNDEVTSIFGRTGDVVAQAGDYNASQVGLGNVTNDAQLKREANDFNTFAEKTTLVPGDRLLIEDSEDSGNKKYVDIDNLGGGVDIWETSTAYLTNDIVFDGTDFYKALTDHTSDATSIANDVIAGNMIKMVDPNNYLANLNSDPQTQIDGKADTNLNNLTGPTSVNENLIPSDGTKTLGNSSTRWQSTNVNQSKHYDASVGDNTGDVDGGNGGFSEVGTTFGFKVEAKGTTGTARDNLGAGTRTKNSADKTGNTLIYTGTNNGTGDSGDIEIKTGNVTTGIKGQIDIDARQIDLNSTIVKNGADPVDDQDLATKIYVDQNAGGGGGLDTYYTQNFKAYTLADIVASGQSTTYNDGAGTLNGTISEETTEIIAGEKSLKYTAGAASINDYFVIATIPVQDREQAVQSARKIWLNTTNYTTNFQVIVYDETNSQIINTQLVEGSSGIKQYLDTFNIDNTVNIISIGIYITEAPVNGEYFIIDDIEFTTDPFVYASIGNVTDLKSAGPINITATTTPPTKGTTVEDRVTWHREGQFAVVRYSYYQSDTIGATAGVGSYLFEIPSEIGVVDTSLVTPYSTATAGGMTIDAQVSKIGGGAAFSNTGPTKGISWEAHLYDENHFRIYTFIAFNNQGYMDDNFFNLNQNALSFEITIKVPIVGWTATSSNIVTPSKSNMFDTKIVQGITIESTGVTQPVKASNLEKDEIHVSQKGNLGDFIYFYRSDSTTPSSNPGAGDYLVNLPIIDGKQLEFDDNLVEFYTTGEGVTNVNEVAWRSYGFGRAIIDGIEEWIYAIIVPYDATRFRVYYRGSSVVRTWGSGAVPLNQTNTGVKLEFTVPIKGWTSENQFLSLIPVQKTAYIKDVKPSGTAGGTATAGSYLTRDLTTVEGNSEIVSLSANQFTLQAGTYEIEAISPFASSNGQRTNPSRIRLQNITDAVTEIYGQATNESYTTNSNGMGHSTIHGQITLNAPKTFEIQYRVTSSYGTNGLGFACNFGEDEIYTVVKITKVK